MSTSRIVQIMAGDEEGGLEQHFVQLCNALTDRGHSVTAVACAKYADRFDPAVQFFAMPLTRSRHDPFTLLRLARCLRGINPAIVHAQANKATAMLAHIASWVPGVKIATVHSQKRKVDMFCRMDGVIGVSRGVLANLTHDRVRVIPNGLAPRDPQAADPGSLAVQFGLRPGHYVTLAVGRLVPVKSFDSLIRAWSEDFGYLLIAGDGPEQETLSALIRERQLEDWVHLLGFRRDVRALMAAADLLVCSSEREGFSYVLGEALLERLPVLSTRVAGAEDVLPAEHLLDPGPQALGEGIRRCLADLGRYREQMEPVFHWAQRELTVDRMAERVLDFYDEVAGGGVVEVSEGSPGTASSSPE